MEIRQLEFLEYTFFILASYLLLFSYYYQYKLITKYLDKAGELKSEVFNRDMIKAQLNGLKENLKGNKYYLWSYFFTVLTICICLYIFNIGGNLKHIWAGLTAFLALQYLLEYKQFLLEALSKSEIKEVSLNVVLDEYETSTSYERLTLTDYQINLLNSIKENIKSQKDIINISKENKQLLISYINGFNELSDVRIHITLSGCRMRNKDYDLIDFDLEDGSLSKVTEVNSSFYSSFYEIVSFNKIFVIGLLEPLIMSLLLFMIIHFNI